VTEITRAPEVMSEVRELPLTREVRSEVRELIDAELDAVCGGIFDFGNLVIARRMGGAKRYPSIASYGDDGFRRLNPSYVLAA